jgi:hypothetical protein
MSRDQRNLVLSPIRNALVEWHRNRSEEELKFDVAELWRGGRSRERSIKNGSALFKPYRILDEGGGTLAPIGATPSSRTLGSDSQRNEARCRLR